MLNIPNGQPRSVLYSSALSALLLVASCSPAEAPEKPVIDMVRPACGPTTGGNLITVIGNGFEEDMQVRLGPSILETTFVKSTWLEVTAPENEPETFSLAIVDAEGKVQAARTAAYRYKDPSTFDPNGDCGVSVTDIHYLSNHLAGDGKPPVLSGDADGDGDSDNDDLDYLVAHLFADGPAPVGSE